MADDTNNKAIPKPDLTPDLPNAAEEINPANDKRSLDIGESGQFAPGGYYNQHGATAPDRSTLDDIDTGAGGDKSKG
jgi:hypothetical protein